MLKNIQVSQILTTSEQTLQLHVLFCPFVIPLCKGCAGLSSLKLSDPSKTSCPPFDLYGFVCTVQFAWPLTLTHPLQTCLLLHKQKAHTLQNVHTLWNTSSSASTHASERHWCIFLFLFQDRRNDSDLPNVMIANLNPLGRWSQHLTIISTDVPAAQKISN